MGDQPTGSNMPPFARPVAVVAALVYVAAAVGALYTGLAVRPGGVPIATAVVLSLPYWLGAGLALLLTRRPVGGVVYLLVSLPVAAVGLLVIGTDHGDGAGLATLALPVVLGFAVPVVFAVARAFGPSRPSNCLKNR